MGEVSFSIVTVARNAAAHIARCLESVAEQGYAHAEHVVIDGASTDGTPAIVRAHASRLGALVSEPDGGIYDAMNKGIRLAKNDYLLFLGADDHLIDRRVLSDAAAYIGGEGEPDFVYGDLEVRDVVGGRSIFRPPPPEGVLDLMICGCLPHQATFAHKRLFERVGGFDTRYKVQSDYDWFLRVLGADGVSKRYFPRVISSFAMGGASSRLRQGQEETYAIQNAFPIYREPVWMEKRLHEFQRQLLAHREQLQTSPAQGLLERALRKTLRAFGL